MPRLGLRWRKTGAIPVPPTKTVEEHAREQAVFLQEELEPRLESSGEKMAHIKLRARGELTAAEVERLVAAGARLNAELCNPAAGR